MQIQQIIYFQRVAELKSMNRAAESLFITQSNLSYAIKKLEEEIGTTLLQRSNKGVVMTENGKKFLEYSKVIVEQMDLIQRMSENTKTRNLTISAYPMMANSYFLKKYYKSVREEETEAYRITIKEERMDGIIKNVSQSESEIGFIHYNQRQEKEVMKNLKKDELEFSELGKTTWYVVVGMEHPLAKKGTVNIKELLEFPVVRAKDDYFSNLTSHFEIDGVNLTEFHKLLFINDNATKMDIIKDSDAFTFIPGWSIKDYQRYGLTVLAIENCNIEITMGWIKRAKEILSQEAEKYLEGVIEFFDN